MCGGGPKAPADNSGAIAQQQEAKRQATIQQDIAAINKVYGGTNAAPDGRVAVTYKGATPGGVKPGAYFQSTDKLANGYYGVYDGPGKLLAYNPQDVYTDGPNQTRGGTVAGFTPVENKGQFDDNFYNKIGTDYTDYYNPQVDDQYKDALKTLTLQLGQQGILQSSEGNAQLTKLEKALGTQKQGIASQALSAQNTAKQQVAQQKSQLLSLANTAADPSAVASQVAQSASSAVSPPQFSPLANAFAGLIGQGSNALAIQSNTVAGSGSNANNSGANANALGKSSYVVGG